MVILCYHIHFFFSWKDCLLSCIYVPGQFIYLTNFTFDKNLDLNRHPSAEDFSCGDEGKRQKEKLFN